MCKPTGQEILRKEKAEVVKVHAPMELEDTLQRPREAQAVQTEAEPRFAQPEQIEEAAPAPEMAELPVQQQELGWKDRQTARWRAYRARKHEEGRKKRMAAADRWLEKTAEKQQGEEVDTALIEREEEKRDFRSGRLVRLYNMQNCVPRLLGERDARALLKQLDSAIELNEALVNENSRLAYYEQAILQQMDERGEPVPQDVRERVRERREKLAADLENAQRHTERLEERLRQMVPAEREIPKLDDHLQAEMYEYRIGEVQDAHWVRRHEWLTAKESRERYLESALRAQRPVTLRKLEEQRKDHLEKSVLPREIGFLKNRSLDAESDLLEARKDLRRRYAADLEKSRERHFEQILEQMDALPSQEEQRAFLEREVRSIGYMRLDRGMSSLLAQVWDGKNTGSNVWMGAAMRLKAALVTADRKYREAHPELNRLPQELNELPAETGRLSKELAELPPEQRRPAMEASWKEALSRADAAVGSYIREATQNASYQIRVPNCAILRSILQSGRFKTQMETNSSGGELGVENRKLFIRESFGIDPDQTDPAEYEIYGYASDGDLAWESRRDSQVGSRVSQYGQVVVKLKKDRMRDRTTMLLGDSLDSFATARLGWADKPDLQMVRNRDCAITAAYRHQYAQQNGDEDPLSVERMLRDFETSYAELQFHGGVRLEDIESVTLLTEMHTPEGAVQGLEQEIPKDLVDQLKALGIPAKIVRGGEEREV